MKTNFYNPADIFTSNKMTGRQIVKELKVIIIDEVFSYYEDCFDNGIDDEGFELKITKKQLTLKFLESIVTKPFVSQIFKFICEIENDIDLGDYVRDDMFDYIIKFLKRKKILVKAKRK